MTNCPKKNSFQAIELLYCTLPTVTWYHPVHCCTISFFNRLYILFYACMKVKFCYIFSASSFFFTFFYRFWLFIKGLTLQWDSGLVQTLFQNVVTRASATETDVSSKSDFYVFIWKRQSNLSKAINKMSPWIILH